VDLLPPQSSTIILAPRLTKSVTVSMSYISILYYV
jgi:hypothetical protein